LRIVVAIVTVVLITLYVRNLDWRAIGTAMADANPLLLIASAAGNVVLIALKSLRLQRLGVAAPLPRLMNMYVSSYAADNLLMSQAGLGVRVALLTREDIPLASAISLQVVEKVLEGIGLAVIATPLVGAPIDERFHDVIVGCLVIGGVGLVVLAAVSLARATRLVRKIADLATRLRDPRVIALTIATWVVELVMIYAVFAALHLGVTTIYAPILVVVAVNLAALVPGLPANLGAFEMAGVVALTSFGVPSEAALGCMIVYHALHTIPVTIAGVPGLRHVTKTKARAAGLPA
jgi:uncharacterized membrane protein YbhN (UPF0104 family)